MNTLTLQITEPKNKDLLDLIAKLDDYLYSIYPAEEVFVVDLDEPKVQDIVFVVAYLDGKAAGCGAYRPLDSHSAELKRIFVDPAYRNRGIASRVMTFLEQDAKQAGFTAMLLETGPMQQESIELYKKFGYELIDRFGEYIDCPSSICMRKHLV
ncbi:GNAT family N-acetyltransferase [Paenibacillus sp. H1-7]|uniref:GNAT family N-acetyltransferase n=1 Tax=Paenibacillus sp. H1-7 TaxID=2282849 RepID=UPI001EF94C17|nr:GNAT family N-acetyltransferase [Paenibacillus sp. H1-7]ULL19126.1 GNAT family N-acetyltransferase [Paenibacillus sp. H1-7]